MAKIDSILSALFKQLDEAEAIALNNGYTVVAEELSLMQSYIEVIGITIDRDDGNVLEGFEDQNAEARANLNEIVKALASAGIALGATVGGAALVAGAATAGAPAVVIGLIPFAIVAGADLAAEYLVDTLSASGISLTGQLVDYSSANAPFADTIVGTTASDEKTTTRFDDLVDGWLLGDLIVNPGGSDRIDGGLGYDTVSYGFSDSISVQFNDGELNVVHTGAFGGVDTLENIEVVEGTQNADSFVFDGINQDGDFYGLGGDDVFLLSEADINGRTIRLYGGEGIDTLGFADPLDDVPAWVDLSLGYAGLNTSDVGGGLDQFAVSGFEYDHQEK